MAALPVLTRDDRNGTVFVQDERPDGTVVVLRCADATAGAGVAAPSDPPGEVIWPMFRSAWSKDRDFTSMLPLDFVLTLDTSELPSGRLEFDISRFVEQVQHAVDSEQRVVHLDTREAAEWGLRLEEAL
ncbi:MAG TPA: hypothetical protein VFY69_04945 [Solirubrobacterales bacterium]|nr:hypothetical protein [Solirubrobacterales bacterium]